MCRIFNMYRINPKILHTPIADGKALLLEPERGLYFELNEVSVVVFHCLKQGKDTQTILEEIVNTFNVSKDEAQSDLMELIEQLTVNNILLN